MKNIDIDKDELSIPARQTIAVIDSYLDRMDDGIVILKTPELQLFCDRWEELNTSINYVSGREFNLRDFAYRGVKITSWDGA